MTIKLSTGLRTNLAGALGFGATFNNGAIFVYSGPQPLSADSPASGTLLGIVTTAGATWTAGSPANGLVFGTPVAGVVGKTTDSWKFTGLAAGTAGWFRLVGNPIDNGATSQTLPRMDGSVGAFGSADMALTNLSVAVGSPNTIDVFQFSVPAQ